MTTISPNNDDRGLHINGLVPFLNEVKGEIADAELDNVSGGDTATTTNTTTPTTTTTTTHHYINWIEIYSY